MYTYKHFLIAASTALLSTFAIAGKLTDDKVAPSSHYGVSFSSENLVGLFYETGKYEFAVETNFAKQETDYVDEETADTTFKSNPVAFLFAMKSPVAADTSLSVGLAYGVLNASGSANPYEDDPSGYALYTAVNYAPNGKITLFTRAAIYEYEKTETSTQETEDTGYFTNVSTGVKINL